jgi:hypothetical protein
MRWAEHVVRTEIRGMHIGFCWESQEERDHQEDLYIDGEDNIKIKLTEAG